MQLGHPPVKAWGLVVWHPPHTLVSLIVVEFNKRVMKHRIMNMIVEFIVIYGL